MLAFIISALYARLYYVYFILDFIISALYDRLYTISKFMLACIINALHARLIISELYARLYSISALY